jgi:transposase
MVDLMRCGREPEELSREIEPSAESIRNWVRQAEREQGMWRDAPNYSHQEVD